MIYFLYITKDQTGSLAVTQKAFRDMAMSLMF